MSRVFLDEIPGLREALAEERRAITRLRELAFMDVPLELCGVEVEQLKPRHWQVLALVENPFVSGGAYNMLHLTQFLWVVSTAHTSDPADASAFAESLGLEEDEMADAAAEILEYIDDAFMDCGKGGGKSSAEPSTGITATIYHELQKAYGWTPDQIREKPFGALFQHLRLIQEDSFRAAGQKLPPSFSRLDAVRRHFVTEHLKTLS